MSETPWLAPEAPDLVWFSGPDATRFLNDLISQEIGDMGDGDARRSFLLGPQGKLAFLLWVIKDGERWGLVTDAGRGEELAAALGRYRIRVSVDVEVETRDLAVVIGDTDGFDLSWPGVQRRLVIGEVPKIPVGTVGDYERLRVGAGEPAWGREVDDTTIPHESGLVPVSVDFDKGCFLGQELVARIDSRGANTPRRLRLLESDGEILPVGMSVVAGSGEAGVVTSSVDGLALAMVRRELEAGDPAHVGDVAVVVRDLPAKPQR